MNERFFRPPVQKPRIRKINDLWYCFTKQTTRWLGMGYTPKDAYDDWQRHR